MDLGIRLLVSVCAVSASAACDPVRENLRRADESAETAQQNQTQIDAADLDFGSPPLGSTVSAVPNGMHRSANCYEADYIDCEYRDENDVHYLVYGHTLTRKRMVIDGRAREGLPFGLRGDETGDQALQWLNERLGPVFTPYNVEGRTGLTSEMLRNQLGYEYSAQIAIRPDGKLEEISVGGIPE